MEAPSEGSEPRSHELGWWRRALATAGVAASVGTLVWMNRSHIRARWDDWDLLLWAEVALFASTLVAMQVRRVELAIFCRATWWALLLTGSFSVVAFAGHPWTSATVMVGAAVALLSMGDAGLRPGTGPFAPRVLTRSLVTMMVAALCATHLLVLFQVALGLTPHVILPLALVGAVIGLARTRSWGLFLYLGAILGCGAAAGLAEVLPVGWDGSAAFVASVYAFMGVLLLVFGAPLLSALVFKRRPGAGARPWGQLLHGALVLFVVGAALYVRLST